MSASPASSEDRRPVAPRRKGWCPGALRPMATGDGLLARVRASGGRLSLGQAAAIAEAARLCGNGLLCLSARANLQLRGVSEATLADLHARLSAIDLLDGDAGAEAVRNIVASPLSDVDPDAACDLAPIVAALEARLRADEALRALPPKFGFALDAGGRLPVGDVEADLRFEAAARFADQGFAVVLSGEDGLAASCAPDGVAASAAALAGAFLRLAARCEPSPRRMRALVEAIGAEAVFAAAGLAAWPFERSMRRARLADALGAQSCGRSASVGAAPPFGMMTAAQFAALVECARAEGASGLRLTPWRALLAVGVTPQRAGRLAEASGALGFIVEAGDPRLGIVACPGAPACLHAARDTQADAARFARLLPAAGRVLVHVSGCAKGCAREAATALTLVGHETGYDLVRAGKAGDAPSKRALSAEAVDALIARERAALAAGERRQA